MMELSEFGRRRRTVVAPLTAVPIVAAIAGAVWASAQPAQYRSSVDIQIPAPVGQSGAAALQQNASTYRSLVGSAQIADAVAQRTGVRSGEIHHGLTTQQPQLGGQSGGLVRVVYVGTNRTAAPSIARDAAVAAAGELMRPTSDSARDAASGAQSAAQSARQAIAAAAKKYGGLPGEEYRSLQAEIARLETDRDAPSGNRSAADLDNAIKERKKRLSALAPRVIEVQALQDQLGQADRKLADTQQALRDAQARLTSAENSISQGSPAVTPVARGPIILRTSAMSLGVGVLLSVAILVLTELTRRRPQPITPVTESVGRPVERA